MGEQQDEDIIEGWKEIAAELGVSTSTAKRYRRTLRLPVKRDVTGVYARREDLRRWASAIRSRHASQGRGASPGQ